jgi:calcineurin-like phosphoesterase
MSSLPFQFQKEKPPATIRVLMVGDVNDKPGMEVVKKYVPRIKSEYNVDTVIVNSDNSAGGLGTTPETASELFFYGADVLTGGNHIFDNPSIYSPITTDGRILRPYNLSFVSLETSVPGSGILEMIIGDQKIIIMHLLGQKDMSRMIYSPSETDKLQIISPFTTVDLLLQIYNVLIFQLVYYLIIYTN